MEILIKTGKLQNIRTNFLAVFLFQENRRVEGWIKVLDDMSGGRISTLFRLRDFKGELIETSLLYFPDDASIRRLLIVGMGKKRDFDLEKARQVFGTAAKFAETKNLKRITLSLSGLDSTGYSRKDLAKAVAESTVMSLYRFKEYKTEKDEKTSPVQASIYDARRVHLEELREGADDGSRYAAGVCYARDLASHPGNVVTPSYLADEARKIAGENGYKCTILGEEELKKNKMNTILSVGQGSRKESKLIILEYDCGIPEAEKVALVGKGITFDTGGISIKPSKKMEEMKFDMCGAAAVLGTMKVLSDLKPEVNITAVVASAENMPDGEATRPGDIIRTYSGKTVEVINTDAEGRLVLCDALSYTIEKYKPDAIIDIATLTGAVIVALGHYASGMLGTNQQLIKKISAAAEQSGDAVWELPLYPEYDEHLKSDFADIRNSNGPGAGTIFGGAFLKQFVGKTPWVHLDIAGTAWDVKEKSYLPKGPTGFGVRLFLQLIQNWK